MHNSSTIRRVAAGPALAIALLAGPAVLITMAPAAPAQTTTQCPPGELEDLYTDQCVPEMTPTVPGGNWGQPAQVPMIGQPGEPYTGDNTAECTPGGEANTGTSIWVPHQTPEATVEASP